MLHLHYLVSFSFRKRFYNSHTFLLSVHRRIFCKLLLNMTSLTNLSNISNIRCSCEFCTTSRSNLLDEDKLLKHQVQPFMQLFPCYHSFCLKCFSTILLASSCASMLQCSRLIISILLLFNVICYAT